MRLADFFRPGDENIELERVQSRKREADFYKKRMEKTVPLMLSDDPEDQLIAEYLQAKLRLDAMTLSMNRYNWLPGAYLGQRGLAICIEEMNRYVLMLHARMARDDLLERARQISGAGIECNGK